MVSRDSPEALLGASGSTFWVFGVFFLVSSGLFEVRGPLFYLNPWPSSLICIIVHQYLAMFISPYELLYQSLRNSTNLYQSPPTSINLYQSPTVSLNPYQAPSPPTNLHLSLSLYINFYQPLSTSINLYQPVSTSSDLYQSLPTFLHF